MTEFIEGFGIGGYRSFGSEVQHIYPCSQVNLFAGPNNSGKSNVLRFLMEHFDRAVKAANGAPGWTLEPIDEHRAADGVPTRLALPITVRSCRGASSFDTLGGSLSVENRTDLWRILTDRDFGDEPIWFRWDLSRNVREVPVVEVPHRGQQWPDESIWRNAYRELTAQTGGDRNQWVSKVIDTLSPAQLPFALVMMVPAVREITGSPPAASNVLSGAQLIGQLAELQNPGWDEQERKERLEQINAFLREVTDEPDAKIEVPANRENLIVHMNGRTLPIASLGTGIHEVVILAVAATVTNDQIICMEEPEIHLHPLLQRKLVKYLGEHTTNQYFIATHSAHLLDLDGASVFKVALQDGVTTVRSVVTPGDTWELARDLGYQASDLMQANCIIWVEGPSDRVYINHWLAAVDPTLIESIDYSVMFYGGRMLNHLSADDREVDDFISLRHLNRNVVVVMDSDRAKSGGRLNETKLRVRAEVEENGGLIWVTAGREIENYVPHALMKPCVAEVASTKTVRKGQYQRVLAKGVDKVKVARAVANRDADVSSYGLSAQVKRLARFIRAASPL